MTNKLKKQLKQEKSTNTEDFFEKFCQTNKIISLKIDELHCETQKDRFLKNITGKCPDFWCQKDGKEIFVEIKTLTNLTNQKRESSIDRAIRENKNQGLPGGITSEVFDPIPELEGPFTTFLKDASNKFKNLKDESQKPRILFVDGAPGDLQFTFNAIFLGAYDSFKKEGNQLVHVGLRKKNSGLFDRTGSNVSAIVYWDKKRNQFLGTSNPKAKIPFLEKGFELFFGKN